VETATTRACLGSYHVLHGRSPEGVADYVHGYRVVTDLDVPIRGQLAGLLLQQVANLGEEAFAAAWRDALPDDDERLNSFLTQAREFHRQQQEEAE
jgi:hypothetical protein